MKKIALFILILGVFTQSFAQSGSLSIDRATFQVGERFFKQGLFTEAEARFLDIVRKYPDSKHYRSALFYLGQTYGHLGKYKFSLQYYKVLLNKSQSVKEKQQAILGIAKSWLQLGVHDKAAEFYSFFASEHPESQYTPAALYFAGIARERENNTPAAIEKYRLILEQYPYSDYYGKAIEKVAVLHDNTPESLWSETTANRNVNTEPSIDLFVGLDNQAPEIPDIEPTYIRAQQVVQQADSPSGYGPLTDFSSQGGYQQNVIAPVQPTVITQIIQSPPTIITQQVIQVVTQEIESAESRYLDSIENSSSVIYSNGQLFPTPTQDEQEFQQKLESYKNKWTQEFQAQERLESLNLSQQQIQDLHQLTQDKANLLNSKEQSLLQKQDQLRNNIYQGLSEFTNQKPALVFSNAPGFLGGATQNPALSLPPSIQTEDQEQQTEAPTPPVQTDETPAPEADAETYNDYNTEAYVTEQEYAEQYVTEDTTPNEAAYDSGYDYGGYYE